MLFPDKLQSLRKSRGISQEELSAQLGVSRQAVSKWELGESLPDSDKLPLIGHYFGVTVDYLLDDSLEPASAEPASSSRQRSPYGPILDFIKKKGYIAGYIISAYAALALLLARFAHYAFATMLTSSIPEGFDALIERPASMDLPLVFCNFVSVLAGIFLIGGLALAFTLKKKNKN